ncbi:hypothetical protein GCM10025789_04220 [Tessaracoccus lubricantis]|uniref:Uncharacterized protein n=1 Tax=Tessaracoccus lubricantis TaxID=545543 RepID=A0ABP9F1R3_9ACTN
MRLFADNAFYEMLYDWVVGVFGKVINGDFNISDLLKIGSNG